MSQHFEIFEEIVVTVSAIRQNVFLIIIEHIPQRFYTFTVLLPTVIQNNDKPIQPKD